MFKIDLNENVPGRAEYHRNKDGERDRLPRLFAARQTCKPCSPPPRRRVARRASRSVFVYVVVCYVVTYPVLSKAGADRELRRVTLRVGLRYWQLPPLQVCLSLFRLETDARISKRQREMQTSRTSYFLTLSPRSFRRLSLMFWVPMQFLTEMRRSVLLLIVASLLAVSSSRKDYYKTLNLQKTASETEIRKSYYRLAREWFVPHHRVVSFFLRSLTLFQAS